MHDTLLIDRAPLGADLFCETWTLNDPASRNALTDASNFLLRVLTP